MSETRQQGQTVDEQGPYVPGPPYLLCRPTNPDPVGYGSCYGTYSCAVAEPVPKSTRASVCGCLPVHSLDVPLEPD